MIYLLLCVFIVLVTLLGYLNVWTASKENMRYALPAEPLPRSAPPLKFKPRPPADVGPERSLAEIILDAEIRAVEEWHYIGHKAYVDRDHKCYCGYEFSDQKRLSVASENRLRKGLGLPPIIVPEKYPSGYRRPINPGMTSWNVRESGRAAAERRVAEFEKYTMQLEEKCRGVSVSELRSDQVVNTHLAPENRRRVRLGLPPIIVPEMPSAKSRSDDRGVVVGVPAVVGVFTFIAWVVTHIATYLSPSEVHY